MNAADRAIPFSPDRDRRQNVEINIGKACNNRCVFCIDGLPKREDRSYLDYEFMKSELEKWYLQGHRSLGFLGGEPTTYPKIVQSVAYARALGFTRVSLATNATKLRLKHFTDKLLEAGLTRITVSMHGHTAELEDRLTRVPGNFEKKCVALRYLLVKRQEGYLRDGVSVNIVLNGWNYKYLSKMMKFFFHEIGVDDLRVNFIRPEGYAEGSAELTPRYTDVRPYVARAIVLNESYFKKVLTFGGFPMCMFPHQLLRDREMLQNYTGELRDLATDCSTRKHGQPVRAYDLPAPLATTELLRYPALLEQYKIDSYELPISTYLGQEHEDILDPLVNRSRFNWQERKRYELKGHPKACDRCDLESVCEGVWLGYLDIWGESEFRPVSIRRADE
jgi:MoaA/NifB/PqqE/SkfB family radical SAM enzyme